MKLRVPHYFDSFACTASECKDNCCLGGWQIEVDEETVEYYKTVKGPFGNMLRDSLECYDGISCIKLKNGICPFLDSDNLCRIYKEAGAEHMGYVCTQFPRFSEYYGNVKESGIGLACEEAARLIFEDNDSFHYVEKEIDEEEYVDSEYDELFGSALFTIREQIYDLLDNKDIQFRDKMCILINSLWDIQQLINSNNYSGIAQYTLIECMEKHYDFSEETVKEIWYAFLEMESINDMWTEYSEKVFEELHPEEKDNTAGYLQKTEQFNSCQFEFCGYDKLVKYFIHRYFMKTVYDHNIFGKIRFIAACLVILKDMDVYKYIVNDCFSIKDRLDNIHMFSREVEYSEDNLEILTEEFMFGAAFERDNLIAVIKAVF